MQTLRFIEDYFLCMMIYSFIGWVYETIICSIEARRLVERGFLNGPYCPIYGVGALLDLLLLGRIENPVVLFFAGMIVTTVLEYLTSYVMELLFHARWWDYSDYKFNINGRVCLIGAVVFGLFSLVLIKVIDPFMMGMLGKLPPLAVHIISAVLFAAFAADIAITLHGFAGFDEKLRVISSELESAKTRVSELIHGTYERENYKLRGIADGVADARERASELLRSALKREGDMLHGIGGALGEAREKLASTIREASASLSEKFESALSFQQRRMIRSFPKLRSVNYDKALSELREYFGEKRKKGKK